MDITNNWYNYLYSERKLSHDVIRMAGFEEVHGLLKIPIYDKDGKYIFSKFRKAPWDTTNTPKYQYERGASVSLYGIDHLTNDIVICEGELDALALITCGHNACSSTGGAMTFQQEWAPLFEGKNVTIMFDNDETGIKGAVRAGLLLQHFTYRWVPPGYGKDIGDVLQNHGVEKVHEVMTRNDNCIVIDIPDLSLKKNLITYRRELRDTVRRFTTGSPGSYFIRELILQLTLKINEKTRPKVPKHSTSEPDILRARAYPIDKLITVKRGTAICPFHEEDTPSLHVYDDNHAYCFGRCRRRYDAIDIAIKVHNVTFTEAVKMLS